MSLHAQLTPHAAHSLKKQKRHSTILSLIISIFTIITVSISLTFFFIKGLTLEEKEDITIPYFKPRPDRPTERPTPISFRPKPSTPSRPQTRLLIAKSFNLSSIPVPEIPNDLPTTEYGNGSEIGNGWNTGDNNPYRPIPSIFNKRCSPEDRLKRLSDNGGNEACEDAVLKALRWLQNNQNKNGSWGQQKPVAMTGLALLAYLGHCETPISEEFGTTVTDGILYLLNNSLQQNGKCASDLRDKHWCYEHAIATYALSESYLFCKAWQLELASELKEAVQSGTQWIIENQTQKGGWDYAYASNGRPGDSSIVAWHLQALKAASTTNLPFPKLKRSISKGLEFLDTCQNQNGGFGYSPNKKPVGSANNHFTLTGAGVLCFQQHKGIQNSNARKGIKYLHHNIQFDFTAQETNLYEHYYASQALINHAGNEWRSYNSLVRNQLLTHQKEDGSWPRSTGPGAHPDPVYSTSLATLMLEVYYRYLPGTTTQ